MKWKGARKEWTRSQYSPSLHFRTTSKSPNTLHNYKIVQVVEYFSYFLLLFIFLTITTAILTSCIRICMNCCRETLFWISLWALFWIRHAVHHTLVASNHIRGTRNFYTHARHVGILHIPGAMHVACPKWIAHNRPLNSESGKSQITNFCNQIHIGPCTYLHT